MKRFSIIVLFIFALFIESYVCMGAAHGLQAAIIRRDIDIICMQRTFDYFGAITKIQSHVDQIFQSIHDRMNDEKWTFVIFSEHFWGVATQALTSAEAQTIVGQM